MMADGWRQILYGGFSAQWFLGAVVKRMFIDGFNNNQQYFNTIVKKVDNALVEKVCHPLHCPNYLLPKQIFNLGIQPKGQPFSLPQCYYDFYRFSFFTRLLLYNSCFYMPSWWKVLTYHQNFLQILPISILFPECEISKEHLPLIVSYFVVFCI